MELRDIRYFLVLSEELHFTRAADRCGVSQPCISAAIRKIEAELGGALIHRKPQPQLTELGQTMRPLWIEALRKVEDSVALALRRTQETAPPLQPAAAATLDEVREAMERIIAAETVDAPPLSPGDGEKIKDGEKAEAAGDDENRSAVILARLRDQRIVSSCRARNGWTPTRTLARHHGELQPPSADGGRASRPKRARRLAFAAVTMMLVAAAGFLLVTLPPGKLFGEGGQATSAASPGLSTSGAASER